MKGFNLCVKEFKDSLLDTVNISHLPISAKVMAVSDVLNTLRVAETNIIAAEKVAYDRELAENAKKGDDKDGEEIHKGR